MKTGDPFLINLACTGVVPTKNDTPHVPITHSEIVEDVHECMELGVQMVHLHARDSNAKHTGDPEPYGKLVESIRALPGGDDIIIGVSTTGRSDPGFEARSRVLELDGKSKPDTASLTLSSLNFLKNASINQPTTIQDLALKMKERGILPELEVFDLGMANYIRVLEAKKHITPPYYVNVLLGNIASAQAELSHIAALLSTLPEQAVVAIAGVGRMQLSSNTYGLLVANGVRVGLEDNVWMNHQRSQTATNAKLVRRVLELGSQLERPMMDTKALRKQLGLPRD